MKFILIFFLLVQASCNKISSSEKAYHLPLQKTGFELKLPATDEKREIGEDPKTREPTAYDDKPRIEVIDAKAGTYALKWIGYDRKEKVIVYQRDDAVDIIVYGSVTRTKPDQYTYAYDVESLPTSGSSLTSLAVQNFASDAKGIDTNNRYIGQMSNKIEQFKNGTWISFSTGNLKPNEHTVLKVSSFSPPGLVECRAHGGPFAIDGTGEDLPMQIDNALPGYEILPFGYTIGPIDKLKSLSPPERAKYILDLLPQLRKLGWMTNDAQKWYEQHLRRNDIDSVCAQAEEDLRAESITSEVFALIQAIKN